MASQDPEFYSAPKFSPEQDDYQPRERGCFFYGCLIAAVLAVLTIIALAVVSYFGYRYLSQLVEQWTATAPVELPRVEIPEADRKQVHERIDAFRQALDKGTASEPLVLTSDDLNALIEDNADFRGTIHARIEGDKLKAQVSFPLDRLEIGLLKGRYLNGEAELKASLSQGVLLVTLDSLMVNGKQPPDELLQELRQQNLAQDAYKNPKNAEWLRQFDSLEIKDGKIILKPRARGAGPPAPGPPAQAGAPLPPPPPDSGPAAEPGERRPEAPDPGAAAPPKTSSR